MAVIDSIVKQAGDSRKSMDWYRRKVQDATGSGTTARGLIRQQQHLSLAYLIYLGIKQKHMVKHMVSNIMISFL